MCGCVGVSQQPQLDERAVLDCIESGFLRSQVSFLFSAFKVNGEISEKPPLLDSLSIYVSI